METFLRNLPGSFTAVLSERIELDGPFLDAVGRFADEPGTVALMSGGGLDSARYHILGIRPWLTIGERGGEVVAMSSNGEVRAELNPFDVLEALGDRFALPGDEPFAPLSSGFLGYLAYDLKDCLEVLPRTSRDDLLLPRMWMASPSILMVHDRRQGVTWVHIPVLGGDEDAARGCMESFRRELSEPIPADRHQEIRVGQLVSGLSREEYIDSVEAVRDYIVRGHVYQVNMSQRFEAPFNGDAFVLFARLFEANPAPFFAYVNPGDHQIVSTSPERFIELRGRFVETRPIKGTRPRGKTPELDRRLRHDLETSFKDDAELSMIVDLLRNDIGKVCAAGTVQVVEHKRVEAYENVYHLVSLVRGELDAGRSAVDLVKATFPGGSITGCPKIRSMEIIDELEPVRRHVYTGSIGYLGFRETMDLSIAIRTITISDGRLVYSVGGGIVYDSDPGDEYEETLHKGRTLSNALERTSQGGAGDHRLEGSEAMASKYGWCNGKVLPQSEIMVSIDEEGFAYGYGFFETVRVQYGRPLRLDAHLERFRKTWSECFASPFPDVTWAHVIEQVVSRNDLGSRIAAVKIMASAGRPGTGAAGIRLIVTARPYTHRLEGAKRNGLRLATYPRRRDWPLADHKTMNYMYQRMAAEWAKERGADEALLLNADGSVSETNTANLLCRIAGKFVRPSSAHVLPGTMEQSVLDSLAEWGHPVETRSLGVEDLKSAESVVVTNALMGVVPVSDIDGVPLSVDEGLCARLNQSVMD
ncbi:MAG: aminodeoxychorismate synthase component I [Fibrobacteria bacterium]|nr:aminodeoxychorismate synthase component I [Fibrobacteria bacterium]